MVAYLLFAGLPIGILAFVTPGAHALTDISIYIFWGGVGIHSAALFIALIASLFQRRWRNAGIYGLCLLVVPLLSCGYCLGAMSLSGI